MNMNYIIPISIIVIAFIVDSWIRATKTTTTKTTTTTTTTTTSPAKTPTKNKKGGWVIALLGILIVIVLAYFFFPHFWESKKEPPKNNQQIIVTGAQSTLYHYSNFPNGKVVIKADKVLKYYPKGGKMIIGYYLGGKYYTQINYPGTDAPNISYDSGTDFSFEAGEKSATGVEVWQ